MPIFQEPDDLLPKAAPTPGPPSPDPMMRRPSEESIRTEFCDGPLPDTPLGNASEMPDEERGENSHGFNGYGVCTSDRVELMERIKRGESPTWVPSQTLQACLRDERRISPSPDQKSPPQKVSPLLPAAEIRVGGKPASSPSTNECNLPAEIQRPWSALHAGDFTETAKRANSMLYPATAAGNLTDPISPALTGSPTTSSYSSTCPSIRKSRGRPQSPTDYDIKRPSPIPLTGMPSLSTSLSSSYILKPPTTPLIQQSNNTDLDFSPIDGSVSPSKSNRRHTLPPRPLHNRQSSPINQFPTITSAARQPVVSYRDENIRSFQTHRSRRSLTSNWSLQTSSSPQTPAFIRSRRTSHSSEVSPLQHASMVGSYEESILRGWMSTAPSKPLDFTAQIGVLGKGNCKPKCPAHVTISFPAVYYSWSNGIGRRQSIVDDEPSPYVGRIDLQQLPPPAEGKKSRQNRSRSPLADSDGQVHMNVLDQENATRGHGLPIRKKRRRDSPTSSVPQNGYYRIPQQGQLQIIIKNPNKTAVKLFLVPYNLDDMEAGTKTFIRQRCYSTDPVIDRLVGSSLSTNSDLSTSKPDKKPVLRYLIHVNICSPSKGRYYLYQNIRVVFANRVPDNKEHLQTEIHLPQPRYSTYHPHSSLSRSSSTASIRPVQDQAYRRRSAGCGIGHGGIETGRAQSLETGASYSFTFESPPPPVPGIPLYLSQPRAEDQNLPDSMDVTYSIHGQKCAPSTTLPIYSGRPTAPTPAIPFDLPLARRRYRPENNRPAEEDNSIDTDVMSRPTTASDLPSPLSDKSDRYFNGMMGSSYKSNSSGGSEGYCKLAKGDVGYGGRPATPEPGEGLLARTLKGRAGSRERVGRTWDGCD